MDKDKTTTVDKKMESLKTDSVSEMSKADSLWQEISQVKIDMFTLPNQTVEMHVSKVDVEPNALYVQLRAAAAFPALESAIGSRYDLEQVDRFLKITKKA